MCVLGLGLVRQFGFSFSLPSSFFCPVSSFSLMDGSWEWTVGGPLWEGEEKGGRRRAGRRMRFEIRENRWVFGSVCGLRWRQVKQKTPFFSLVFFAFFFSCFVYCIGNVLDLTRF